MLKGTNFGVVLVDVYQHFKLNFESPVVLICVPNTCRCDQFRADICIGIFERNMHFHGVLTYSVAPEVSSETAVPYHITIKTCIKQFICI
jgi:hypothetical protein